MKNVNCCFLAYAPQVCTIWLQLHLHFFVCCSLLMSSLGFQGPPLEGHLTVGPQPCFLPWRPVCNGWSQPSCGPLSLNLNITHHLTTCYWRRVLLTWVSHTGASLWPQRPDMVWLDPVWWLSIWPWHVRYLKLMNFTSSLNSISAPTSQAPPGVSKPLRLDGNIFLCLLAEQSFLPKVTTSSWALVPQGLACLLPLWSIPLCIWRALYFAIHFHVSL